MPFLLIQVLYRGGQQMPQGRFHPIREPQALEVRREALVGQDWTYPRMRWPVMLRAPLCVDALECGCLGEEGGTTCNALRERKEDLLRRLCDTHGRSAGTWTWM